jgi:hypothetical protein
MTVELGKATGWFTVSAGATLLAAGELRTTKQGPDRRVRSNIDIVSAWMQLVP